MSHPSQSIAPPEPDLTPTELIARAAALRPMLVERQAEVEERTYHSEDVHRELQKAGIYRTYVPRRHGGCEFDVPTFARIGIEPARGCPSTGWCVSLASNHALQVGSFFGERTLAAVMVGAVYNALDEYERQLHAKTTPLPPFVRRREDPDYQRYFGAALAKIGTAEAALLHACEQHMEHCRRAVEEGVPYSYGVDMLVGCIAREVMVAAWETMQADIFRTSGSSSSKRGERPECIYRDLSMGNSHRNTLLRDFAYREIARERLGIPRERVGQQRGASGRAAGQGLAA